MSFWPPIVFKNTKVVFHRGSRNGGLNFLINSSPLITLFDEAMKLSPQDEQHLDATEALINLRDFDAAHIELFKVSPNIRGSFDFLWMRCWFLEETKNWIVLEDTARALVNVDPTNSEGYVSLSLALHRRGMTEDAISIAKEAHRYGIDDPALRYNVAKFTCTLMRLDEARAWLRATFSTTLGSFYRPSAVEEPELKPLWTELQLGQF